MILLSVSFNPQALFCQDQPERRPLPLTTDSFARSNFTSITFDKFIDTYQWNGMAYYRKTMGPLSIALNERFFSTVVRTDPKRITDRQHFNLSAMHRLTNSVQAAAQVSSFIVSDNRSIGISNISSNALYGGIAYQPFPGVTMTPLIGVRIENQIDKNDRGASYLVNLTSDSLEYDGYRTQIVGKFQYDNLSPRIMESRNIFIGAEKFFFGKTRNLLQLNYYRNRRDFYSPADIILRQQFNITHNIETRSEDAFTVIDSLDYSISNRFTLTFQGNLFARDIDKETRFRSYSSGSPSANTTISELRIGGGTRLNFSTGRAFDGFVQFTFQERDESHQVQPDDSLSQTSATALMRLEERKNNRSRRTSFATAMMIGTSKSHAISLSGSTSLLQYDTPAADNYDDRDELWYVLNLTTDHRINQHLSLRISADANLTHLVYLSSKRSADNTWNRIFRLFPRIEYIPSKTIKTINAFEVLANYTVYDFEYQASSIRSYVYRQFGFTDSTMITFTRKLSAELFTQWRFYERGELRWDAFAERPTNYFEDRTYIFSVRYQLQSSLLFSVGIRYFSQLRFNYIGNERSLESFLRSSGTITTIVWSVTGHAECSLRGWYEVQSQSNAVQRSFANMTMLLTIYI